MNRRKGDVGGRPGGPHHMVARPGGLHERDSKIGTSGFVSSNFENISRTTFLKYKTAENRNWHCGILLIS